MRYGGGVGGGCILPTTGGYLVSILPMCSMPRITYNCYHGYREVNCVLCTALQLPCSVKPCTNIISISVFLYFPVTTVFDS